MVGDSKVRDTKRHFRLAEAEPSMIVARLLVWLFLGLCVLFPLFCVLRTPTGADLKYVLSSQVWRKAALNTALECVASTTLSVLIGYVYAYAVVKGRIPFARFFSLVPILHLVTPPFVGGLSFILLLGRNGFITHTLLGLDVSLYGFWGLLIAQSLCFFPMAYMICSQNLRSMDIRLEEVAITFGANRALLFFKVILPMSLPGIVSSLLFIAVAVMSDFGNPMIVAGRFRVLAVEVYTQLTGWANAGTSAILGLMLVLPSLVLFTLQNILAKRMSDSTASIGDNSVQGEGNAKPSKLTRILLTAFCALVSFMVLAQFASIIAGSLQKIWGVNTTFTWDHLRNLRKYSLELGNSVRFALYGAAISTLVATFASYNVGRTHDRLGKVMNVVALLPSAIPGTLYGLAFALAASLLHLHWSQLLIVISIAVGFLPFSYRIISSSFAQIKPSLDEGAITMGASRLLVLSRIIAPIARDGMVNSLIYDFVRGVGTMSSVIFLVSFDTPLASIKILNLAEQGFWGDAAALATLLTLITFAVIGVARLLQKVFPVVSHAIDHNI